MLDSSPNHESQSSQAINSETGDVLATNDEAINQYWNRRNYLEDYLFKDQPLDRQVRLEGITGPADVRVLSSFCEIPAELKTNHRESKPGTEEVANISVFIPGLFEAAKPNRGNHPQEIKLASALLTGGEDAFMMLKAEGLNSAAYDHAGQKIVSQAAVQRFIEELQGYLTGHENVNSVNVKVIGYSEGSTQGASITARLIEMADVAHKDDAPIISGLKNLNIQEYSAICGGGLAGVRAEDQSKADCLQQLLDNLKHVKVEEQRINAEKHEKEGVYGKTPVLKKLIELDNGLTLKTVNLNPELMKGLEQSLSPERPADKGLIEPLMRKLGSKLSQKETNQLGVANLDEIYDNYTAGNRNRMLDDIKNVGLWFTRFATTGFPVADLDNEPAAKTLIKMFAGQKFILKGLQAAAAKLHQPSLKSVPLERVNALFSVNDDYQVILDAPSTKLTVLVGNKDMFFPNDQVLENLKTKINNSVDPKAASNKCSVVITDFAHDDPHNNPNGVAYILETLTNAR